MAATKKNDDRYTIELAKPRLCNAMIIMVKDDSKGSSYDAVGLATYSSTVWTHASIFETLWIQDELAKAQGRIKQKVSGSETLI
jgi:hypothetical protein